MAGFLLFATLGSLYSQQLAKNGRNRQGVLFAVAGINGCASVISAVLATLLAMQGGFTLVIVPAIGLYLVAAWSFPGEEGRRQAMQ